MNNAIDWPESGSKWEHHSGRVYVVVDIANGKTERPDQYPVTVIYQNVDNGTLWSRPLSDWARSFKPCHTKEQRDREELVDIIMDGFTVNESDAKEIAENILAAGYRKPE